MRCKSRLPVTCPKKIRLDFRLLVGLLVLGSVEGAKTQWPTKDDCRENCQGDRDSDCAPISGIANANWTCQCHSGYFAKEEKSYCDAECDDAYWSLFTYGTCFNSKATNGQCQLRYSAPNSYHSHSTAPPFQNLTPRWAQIIFSCFESKGIHWI